MLRKLFLPAILALALTLTAGKAVQAQHGHSGGSHHSGHPNNRQPNGGQSTWYGGGYGHNHGFVRFGIYPSFGYGYRGYGYGYGYPYYSSYYYPSTAYYPATYYYPTTPTYVVPVETTQSAYPVIEETATVRVIVPDPQGSVWFNGTLTQQTGRERMFTTPALTNGTDYTYTIRAQWLEGGREIVQERVISVAPGGTYVVDFSPTGIRNS